MKKLTLVIFAFSAILSPLMAEKISCMICGEKDWVSNSKPCPKHWQHYDSGYLCPKQSCHDEFDKRCAKAVKKYKKFSKDLQQNVDDDEKLVQMIAKLNTKLASDLIAARKETETSQKQIALLNKSIKKINVSDFWQTFVAYADMKAIATLWPDPADEKVYLSSKTHSENVQKAEEKELQDLYQQALAAQNNPQLKAKLMSKITQNPDGSIELGGRINKATKNGATAFALGRSKKDNSIRYVEREKFSKEMLTAAIKNGRADVLAYFIKQCGGNSDILQKQLREQWFAVNAELIYQNFLIANEIRKIETAKKTAEDKYEIKKLNTQLDKLNKNHASSSKHVAKEITTIIFNQLDPYELSVIISNTKPLEQAYTPRVSMQQLAKLNTSLMNNQGLEGIMELADSQKELTEKEKREITQIYHATLFSQFEEICSLNSETGKWLKWRREFQKNWKKGVVDPWLPMFISQDSPNQWEWQTNVSFVKFPGKISDYKEYNWNWHAGTPDLTRPGYIATEKEGVFCWKDNIPDTKKLGFVSAVKEGKWELAAGFTMKEGKAVWTPGTVDPKRPGLVADKTIFTWIPDAKHLWKDQENTANLDVIEDYKALSTVGKICLLPVVIILGIH